MSNRDEIEKNKNQLNFGGHHRIVVVQQTANDQIKSMAYHYGVS